MPPKKRFEYTLSLRLTQAQIIFINQQAGLHNVNKADIIRDALDLYMLTAPGPKNGFLKRFIKGVLQEER